MPHDVLLSLAIGIFVLGSVFGVSHWRKLRKKVEKILQTKYRAPKPPQRAIPISSAIEDELDPYLEFKQSFPEDRKAS
jgi:hypothetical protein